MTSASAKARSRATISEISMAVNTTGEAGPGVPWYRGTTLEGAGLAGWTIVEAALRPLERECRAMMPGCYHIPERKDQLVTGEKALMATLTAPVAPRVTIPRHCEVDPAAVGEVRVRLPAVAER